MAEKKQMTDFEKLYNIDVSKDIDQKNGLNYLSWPYAVREFKKVHPDMTYEVKTFENGLPYAYDPNTGYMVYTSVTVDGLTHSMWLPVMDSNNRAMKSEPYVVKTKNKDITVNAATMFDINKTIMRCLVKNLAMFGLALWIFAGEDLPDSAEDPAIEQPKKKQASKSEKSDEDLKAELKGLLMETESDTLAFLEWASRRYKRELKAVDEMHRVELEDAITMVGKKKKGDN